MTRREFVDRYRHQVMGHVCEGVYAGRRNEMLAQWMRATMGELDQLIARMYDDLNPQPPAAGPPPAAPPEVKTNGQAIRK